MQRSPRSLVATATTAWLVALLALAGCGGGGTDASSSADAHADAAADVPSQVADLRLNHIQVIGTHNSYHIAPKVGSKEWMYTHEPLDVQAAEQRVRNFELDVHWNADTGAFEVRHINVLDPNTTCSTLKGCLQTLRTFSDAHPGHVPLWIWIESKDSVEVMAVPGMVDKLGAEIDAIWPAERRISPDDIRHGEADPKTGLAKYGWPQLDAVRGRAIFTLLDHGAIRDTYVQADPTLQGKVLFAEGKASDPWGVVTKFDDPQGSAAEIQAAAAAGLLIRTRADAGDDGPKQNFARRDAALASAAHACATDYPAEVPQAPGFVVQLPGGLAARCNPVTAPPGCVDALVEP